MWRDGGENAGGMKKGNNRTERVKWCGSWEDRVKEGV